MYFYDVARRAGIDRIAAMAHRLGLGTELALDLPAQRDRADPDARLAHAPRAIRGSWARRSISGIGQGYVQVTPLQLATYAARARHRARRSSRI